MNAPHPDVDELADLAEGLLAGRRAVEVETHVRGCADCAGLLATVRAVPALLADVPTPPMPPEAAARLDAELRAEAARRTQETSRKVAAPSSLDARRRSGSWGDRHPGLRMAAAAAATVAVLGGAVSLIGSQGLSTGGTADTSSAEDEGGALQRESAGGGLAAAKSDRSRRQYAAELANSAQRLQRTQEAEGIAGLAPATAAAAMVHGLRVGMAAS